MKAKSSYHTIIIAKDFKVTDQNGRNSVPLERESRKTKSQRPQICFIYSKEIKDLHFTYLDAVPDQEETFTAINKITSIIIAQSFGPSRMEEVCKNIPEDKLLLLIINMHSS